MYVCMYVCMHVCMYMCMCTCMYTCLLRTTQYFYMSSSLLRIGFRVRSLEAQALRKVYILVQCLRISCVHVCTCTLYMYIRGDEDMMCVCVCACVYLHVRLCVLDVCAGCV